MDSAGSKEASLKPAETVEDQTPEVNLYAQAPLDLIKGIMYKFSTSVVGLKCEGLI